MLLRSFRIPIRLQPLKPIVSMRSVNQKLHQNLILNQVRPNLLNKKDQNSLLRATLSHNPIKLLKMAICFVIFSLFMLNLYECCMTCDINTFPHRINFGKYKHDKTIRSVIRQKIGRSNNSNAFLY